ncbi:zinc ribbon domain-containing protein [Stigmatella sp. ncwal1]|uniref:Zinc ribbon domain-containing protein n=1 Tax=Stigmatella ashevillensis TaxID=2995309 RepID=A0ABT5D873_9BACT|nr:zinc ribbon domain-containing protein [Stigmatella ashevillena]MDC0709856.1 zinc ribbon domain-containing protein [Stigmatella ashevillena]
MPSTESSCTRCHSALEAEDLRCTVCALPTPERAQGPEGLVKARVTRCGTCGAAVAYSVEVQAPRCAYCTSVMHTETQADPVDQADRFVPFTVEPEAARKALQTFLGSGGFFRPSDLASTAAIDSLKPLWWPAWAFDAQAVVTWAADTNEGARRSDWAPHAGEAQFVLRDILVSASRGLTLKETTGLASSYELSQAVPGQQGPSEAQVELFDVTRSGARRQILATVQEEARAHVARTEFPGRRHRNLHVAVVLSGLKTRHFELPAYVLAYRYRHKLYRVVVHGQQAGCVLGDRPVSVVKVVLTVFAGLLLAALLLRLLS